MTHGNVLRLVPRAHAQTHEDTIAVLLVLLENARAGGIEGLVVTLKTVEGGQDVFLTGLYDNSPAEAGNAALRLCWRIAQAQDKGLI